MIQPINDHVIFLGAPNTVKTRKFLLTAVVAAQIAWPLTGLANETVNNYLRSGTGEVVTDGSGECWRTSYADTTEKLVECGYPGAETMSRQVEVVAAPTAASVTSMAMDDVEIAAIMLFAFDSANLSEDGKAIIDERVQTLRGEARLTSAMQIVGHTDNIGTDEYNLGLSERRAQAVADYIVAQSYNVKESDIEISAKGESDPIATNDTSAGRAQNRRVAVFAEATTAK
jgi:OOP family OmpA-OmpF porin